jgi:hypothetical protein
MNWTSVASNQTFSGNTLQNAVTNGFFTVKPIGTPIPLTDEQLTKSQVESMVNILSISGKTANQLVVKSNLTAIAVVDVTFHTKLSSFSSGWKLVLVNESGVGYYGNQTSVSTGEYTFVVESVPVGTIFYINIDNGSGSAFIGTVASKIDWPPSANACSYVNRQIQINNTSEDDVWVLGNPSVICYPF